MGVVVEGGPGGRSRREGIYYISTHIVDSQSSTAENNTTL